MRFKSDKHRKAVFANMFGRVFKGQTKVSLSGVKNFETQTTKMKKMKPPRVDIMVRGQRVTLGDIKKTKEESVACKLCKRKNLKLSKKTQACKKCEKEVKNYKQPDNTEEIRRKLDQFWEALDDWNSFYVENIGQNYNHIKNLDPQTEEEALKLLKENETEWDHDKFEKANPNENYRWPLARFIDSERTPGKPFPTFFKDKEVDWLVYETLTKQFNIIKEAEKRFLDATVEVRDAIQRKDLKDFETANHKLYEYQFWSPSWIYAGVQHNTDDWQSDDIVTLTTQSLADLLGLDDSYEAIEWIRSQ